MSKSTLRNNSTKPCRHCRVAPGVLHLTGCARVAAIAQDALSQAMGEGALVPLDVMESLPAGTSPEHVTRLQEWEANPAKMQSWLKSVLRLNLLKDAEVAQGDSKEAADARKRIAQVAERLLSGEGEE